MKGNNFKVGDRVRWCKAFVDSHKHAFNVLSPYLDPVRRGTVTAVPPNLHRYDTICVRWDGLDYESHPHPDNLAPAKE